MSIHKTINDYTIQIALLRDENANLTTKIQELEVKHADLQMKLIQTQCEILTCKRDILSATLNSQKKLNTMQPIQLSMSRAPQIHYIAPGVRCNIYYCTQCYKYMREWYDSSIDPQYMAHSIPCFDQYSMTYYWVMPAKKNQS